MFESSNPVLEISRGIIRFAVPHRRLELFPNGTVSFYIDGVLIRTVTGAVSTSVDLSLILAVEAKGANIEIMHVDYLMVEANRDWTA